MLCKLHILLGKLSWIKNSSSYSEINLENLVDKTVNKEIWNMAGRFPRFSSRLLLFLTRPRERGRGKLGRKQQNGGESLAKLWSIISLSFPFNMSTLKFLSNCRYIASPFSNLEDLSWRILLRNLGVHLCFTRSVTAVDCVGNTNNLFGSATKGHADRPLIVQVRQSDIYGGVFLGFYSGMLYKDTNLGM